MGSLEKFSNLRQNYSQIADFVLIYIAEAHPAPPAGGKEHFTGNYDIETHRRMEQRVAAAQTFRKEGGSHITGCTILVDPMDDRANHGYAALPERLYVILDGTVIYEGGLGPFDYKLEEVEDCLRKMK